MDPVSVALFLFLLLLIFLFFRSSRPMGRLPPGPPGLPLLGSFLAIRHYDYLVYTRWRKEYGELVYFKIGLEPILLLNSYRAAKAAYIDQGDIFCGRSNSPYLREMAFYSGIAMNDGPVWKEHRRFALHYMRDFGMGRTLAESIVDSEREALLKRFDEVAGRPISAPEMLTTSMENVIGRIVISEPLGANNQNELDMIHQHIQILIKNLEFVNQLPFAFPFIIKIPPLLRFIESLAPYRPSVDFLYDKILRTMDEHLKELGPEVADMDTSQAKDVCDALLIERARLEREGVKHSFTVRQLQVVLLELVLAALETTTSTIVWSLFYLCSNPDVQRRLQAELDREIGEARRTNMKDRPNLHYTCAVMDEVMRRSSLSKTGIPHRTMADTELLGYHIPADTTVLMNSYSIHHDPELWERPNDFWPGHFLDDQGRYQSSPHVSAFSIGKRACLGESLARMEIFLLLTGIMQMFTIRFADPNADVASLEATKTGVIRHVNPHEVILERREKS